MSSRLIDELRTLTPKDVDPRLTRPEVQEIIDILTDKAREAAKKKKDRVTFHFESFLRKGVLAGVPVPRRRVEVLERHFELHGLRARYCNDMSCGACYRNDCDKNAHYGYILEWNVQ